MVLQNLVVWLRSIGCSTLLGVGMGVLNPSVAGVALSLLVLVGRGLCSVVGNILAWSAGYVGGALAWSFIAYGVGCHVC